MNVSGLSYSPFVIKMQIIEKDKDTGRKEREKRIAWRKDRGERAEK